MKNITTEQINALLQAIYQTNISAQTFDQIKKLLSELPEVKEKTKNEK
jgi:transposase-like protein